MSTADYDPLVHALSFRPVEATYDPGWAYCPLCNGSADDYSLPLCGRCAHGGVLPLPTTAPRPIR